MPQLVVRNLEQSVRVRLQRRAKRMAGAWKRNCGIFSRRLRALTN